MKKARRLAFAAKTTEEFPHLGQMMRPLRTEKPRLYRMQRRAAGKKPASDAAATRRNLRPLQKSQACSPAGSAAGAVPVPRAKIRDDSRLAMAKRYHDPQRSRGCGDFG